MKGKATTNISNSIKHYREKAGLTQEQVCEEIDELDRTVLSKAENGLLILSEDVSVKVAKVLCVTIGDLYNPHILEIIRRH